MPHRLERISKNTMPIEATPWIGPIAHAPRMPMRAKRLKQPVAVIFGLFTELTSEI